MKFLATAVILAATMMSLTASACKDMSAKGLHSATDAKKWAALENTDSSSQSSTIRSAVSVRGADGSVRK